MNIDICNSFIVIENNRIPPISSLGEPKFDKTIQGDMARLEVLPIFGYCYSALVPRSNAVELVKSLSELEQTIEESHEKHMDLYYKKKEIPLIGWLLAKPVSREGDNKLLEYESISRRLHQNIKELIFMYMTKSDKDLMIK